MRTEYCGQVGRIPVGTEVQLCGWVHRRRDHGGIIFIDLRDREGICQVVAEPENAEAFATADRCRSEYVIQVRGVLRPRPEGMTNERLSTGHVELLASSVQVLSEAETPAFPLQDYSDPGEQARLRYRYLDLRRSDMNQRLKLRSQAMHVLRNWLHEQSFYEVETPQLVLSTPEGARDYLVPSRVQPGKFFALAQSPQLYKQLLMVGGVDRYYQIARCFRDEDLRADRQPEFTQLDLEMSFVEPEDVMQLAEKLMAHLLKELMGFELPPVPRLSYAQAMNDYGSDKPDLRNPLHLVDVGSIFADQKFAVLQKPANDPESRVACLCLPGGASLPRSKIDAYTQLAQAEGAGGLAWIRVEGPTPDQLNAPILKFLNDECLSKLLSATQAQAGDMLFFGAGKRPLVNHFMDVLIRRMGADQQLLHSDPALAWVHEFPMFERTSEGGWTSCHHPFTQPVLHDQQDGDLYAATSNSYDLVFNGYEIAGGSIRISDANQQLQILTHLGFSAAEAERQFGFLLRALRSGCPPHGGIAFGLDRIMMILSKAENLREVIAFPKTQTAACLLTGAPLEVEPDKLAALGLRPGNIRAPSQSG
ncbi:MAG: aspartate--tRNA ligase [Gammaproteobacteria bacterium]